MSGVFSGQQWTTSYGSTWSVLIEPDFVNQVAELCNHLTLAHPESRAEFEELVSKAQQAAGDSGSQNARKEVLKAVLGQVGQKGVSQGAEAKDVEGFANLSVALIHSTFEGKEADDLIVELAQGLGKSTSSESQSLVNARYSSLSSIFNSLPASAPYTTRSAILLSLFKLAAARNELSVLSSALAALPAWLSSEWQINDSAESDKILSSFVEAIESSKSADSEDKQEVIRALLTKYANENTSEELKSKLLLYTLASSKVYDLETLSATTSDANLARLRDIFLSGTLGDLTASTSNLPQSLDAEKLQEKLKYVILADFCSGRVGQTVSYDEVAKIIELQDGGDEEDKAMEVESWIIATIKAGLLAARLHQPSNSISIIRASPRRFGKEQWQSLQSRLEAWKGSVGSVLETVGRAFGQSGASRQSQHPVQDASSITSAANTSAQEIQVA